MDAPSEGNGMPALLRRSEDKYFSNSGDSRCGADNSEDRASVVSEYRLSTEPGESVRHIGEGGNCRSVSILDLHSVQIVI